MKTLLATISLLVIVLLSGCASGPPPQPISKNPLVKLAVVEQEGMFAADREGRKLAFAQRGLTLLDLNSSIEQKLSSDRPLALAWNRDGSILAAAFQVAEYETRLELYSPEGELLHEALLPVAFNQLKWSARGDLLVTGFVLKVYSFGGGLQQILYTVAGGDVVANVLSDSTLRLATVKKLAPIIRDVLPVLFSPAGDELVYAHLHEPPQFSPYLKLLYLNWQVGGARSLQTMPLQSMQVAWDNPGQSVSVHSANGVQNFDLWPVLEDVASQPATDRYRFMNGRLYDGDELLVDWGAGAQLQILSDGRFLLAMQKNLYLGDGLRAELQDDYNEKRWTLRRWRFEGLITPHEYQELLREENQ